MANKAEETTLEKVERELKEFQSKKGESESALNKELEDAEAQYKSLVTEIKTKYNVDELTEDIKRHSYFLKLLKGEVAIPDDLNAKKTKKRSTATSSEKVRLDWPGKWEAVYEKAGKKFADKVTLAQIKPTLFELFPSLSTVETTKLTSALISFQKKNK